MVRVYYHGLPVDPATSLHIACCISTYFLNSIHSLHDECLRNLHPQAVEKQEKIIRDAHNAIVNKNASATADANITVESKNVPVNRIIEITPNKSTTTSSDVSGSPGTGAEKENK